LPVPNCIFSSSAKLVLSLASLNTALPAGYVQNTSFVPAVKLTAESLLELDKTVVRAKVSGVASVIVPIPTSHSFALWCAIA